MATTGTEATAASRSGAGNVKSVALWVLQVLLAANFIFAGAGKLAGMEQMVLLFDEIGVGHWFRYFTGVMEITGALVLLIPSAAWIGAAGLGVVMAGAVVTEVFIVSGNAMMPLVLLILVSLVAYARRPTASGASRRSRNRAVR